jgi:alanine racemase
MRPSYREVNLKNLESNLQRIKSVVGRAKILAVVKADAYGHGLIPCARKLQASNVDYLGVALVEEGILLRQAGITLPILVFGGVLENQIDLFIAHNLEITISSIELLSQVQDVALKNQKTIKAHLKLETGMERIGVPTNQVEDFFKKAGNSKNIEVIGIYSHLATAEDLNEEFCKSQIRKFGEAISNWKDYFKTKPLFHLANTAGIIHHHDSHFDMVRAGLAIYGIYPKTESRNELKLNPIMEIKSSVVFSKTIPAGTTVGYGQTWTAKNNTRIVTIPIGYGDGYLISLSNKGFVLIKGKRYPIVGRVCMDQITVDVGDDKIQIGEVVTLLGNDFGQNISVNELADLSESIPHQVVAGLTSRLPIIYK